MGIIQTGPTSSSSAKIETIKALRYTPGLGALIRFTAVFTTGIPNSTQIIGIGDDLDGFFFGYNGASFGILRRQNGTDNWIPQSDWNTDQFNGTGTSRVTLNPSLGSVYTIQYQWLGFGDIRFFIENPITGDPTLVHIIRYSNANTIPSIMNPTLPIMAQVINTTNTNNIVLQTSSAIGIIEGNGNTNSLVTRNSFNNTKIAIGTTQISIFTLQNKTIFQSKLNRVRVQFDMLSFLGSANQNVIFSVVKNPTLGGAPIFTDISTDTSVIAVDTSGTTVTGGTTVLTFAVNGPGSAQIPLLDLNIEINPGDIFTFSAQTTSATTDASIAASWKELW
ncbi:hypothetical protein COD67_10200 [Bacillus cereus]|nr:hypothetical protein COI89_23310 [Bacillus cereus]PGU67362.1 hypothetical protein COD67_10200 [Bacillus cereus]